MQTDDDPVTVDERELVNLRTRVQRDTADRLAAVARTHERSLAAEIRVAIVRHLAVADRDDRAKRAYEKGVAYGEAERVRLETALREADEHLKVDSLGVGLARTIISEAIADSGTGERITHGRHCTCSACAREDWSRITAPCGMHGEACPAVYAPLGSAGSWSIPGSTGASRVMRDVCSCGAQFDSTCTCQPGSTGGEDE